MGCEDFDDVCGIVIVVREVYVDVEVVVVMGVGGVNASNKVVFDTHGV